MPLEYTPISQLNSSQKEWKIRVLRIWDFHSKHKPEVVLGIEAILVDEKGDRIQASVKQKLIKKYEREFKEGEYLDVMNFEIPNLSRFNLSPFPDILSQSNVDDVFIGKISVQNSRFSTKLFLNEDIDEISAFKKGMASADTLAPFTVSPMVPPTRNKKDVESFPLSCWKTIDQIASTMEHFKSNVVGGMLGAKAVVQQRNHISIQYKVQVKVADHTGSTCFILFDREVIQLIHKSAYELLEQQVQFNREGEIPQELMDLEGRKFAWIIRVKGTEKNYKQPSFKVFKLTDKPEVIHKFQDNVTMEVTTHPDLAISSSTCSAMQVENTSSEANDNDLPSCSPMTPTTKRQRSHSIDDEGIEESSTKPKGTSKMAKAESGKKVGNLKKESTKAKH
ncbi:hypothetical protein Bca101_069713 [Brassica carinata]